MPSFSFSPVRVAQLLTRISDAMGAQPVEHERFKIFAEQSLRRTMNAVQDGDAAVRWHLSSLRQELAELQQDLGRGISITGRAELQRMCRREWLQNLVQWLEDDLEGAVTLAA